MQLDQTTKHKLMRTAIAMAQEAMDNGDSPFGAVIADLDGNVIVKTRNTTKTDCDPTAHAEIKAIRQAAQKLQTKNLGNFCLVSNAQSCSMCFSAAVRSGITHFLYGYAEDETLVPKISVHQLREFCVQPVSIESKILEQECRQQLAKARAQQKTK